MSKTFSDQLHNQLGRPFAADQIEWRIGSSGKHSNGIWASVFAYVTNRAIQDRLDDVVGPASWQNEYKPWGDGSVICGLSIDVPEKGWVTKWDGADNTDFEPTKGGLSDSMKRAAVQWGIGRYLYSLESAFLPNENISEERKPGWKSAVIKKTNDRFFWTPPNLPTWALPSNAISEEQVSRLKQLTDQLPAEKVHAFHDAYGIERIDQLPSAEFDKASKRLNATIKALSGVDQ